MAANGLGRMMARRRGRRPTPMPRRRRATAKVGSQKEVENTEAEAAAAPSTVPGIWKMIGVAPASVIAVRVTMTILLRRS